MLRYTPLLCALLALAGCSNVAPTENRDADIQAIKDTEAAWVKDIATKDADKWAQHYAEDGVLLLPTAPAIVGRDNIRAALKPFTADPAFTLTFTAATTGVSRSGDIGFTRGTYSLAMTDPKTKQPVTEHGKYVTVYRKAADGKWLAIEDISTPDMPPPGEAH